MFYLLFKLPWQGKVIEEMVVIMFGLLFMENKFCASVFFCFAKIEDCESWKHEQHSNM